MALILEVPTWIVAGFHATSFAFLGISLSALGLGYASVLGLLRTRLREDAQVAGRRAIVVGVGSMGLIVALAASFRVATPSALATALRIIGFYFVSGSVVTAGLFFPWIVSRPKATSVLDQGDEAPARELPDGSSEPPFVTLPRQRNHVV